MSWQNNFRAYQATVEDKLTRSFALLGRAGEGGDSFCKEVDRLRMHGKIEKDTLYYTEEFVNAGYVFDRVVDNIVDGVMGKYFLDYLEKEAPRDYRPTRDENVFLTAFEDLALEVKKNTRNTQQHNSGGGFGRSSNSGGGHRAPSFGNGGGSSNSDSGWGGGSRSTSPMAQATRTTATQQEVPIKSVEPVQHSNPEFVVDRFTSLPYYVKGKEVLVVQNNCFNIIPVHEVNKMAFDYYKHELNTQFLEAHRRYGTLLPESHFEVTGDMHRALSKPMNGDKDTVQREMEALNKILELQQESKIDLDLKVRRCVVIPEKLIVETVDEAVMKVTRQLTAEGFGVNDLYAQFTIDRRIPMYIADSDIDLLKNLVNTHNLQQVGDHLLKMKDAVSHNVWHKLEQRLTVKISDFLCSTLPIFIRLDSFIQDYETLNRFLLNEFDKRRFDAQEQLVIIKALNSFASALIGDFQVEEVDTVEEETDDTDVVARAFQETRGKHFVNVYNVLEERYLMVPFSSAHLRLALPALVDADGNLLKIQPSGGVVDDITMPKLHESLKLFWESYDTPTFGPLPVTYLLTNDNHRCRVSHSLLEDGLFVLDLPQIID